MSKLDLITAGIGGVTAFCTAAVVTNIAKSTTPDNLKVAGKIVTWIGTVTLAATLGDLVARETAKEFEEAVVETTEFIDQIKDLRNNVFIVKDAKTPSE